MTNVNPDNLDELLSAYLDDELTDSERAEVERRMAADPEVRARLDSLKRTVELVASLPRRAAPADLLRDLAARTEREQLLGEDKPVTGRVRTRPRSIVSFLATAALVTITVGGALWVVFQVGERAARTGEGPQLAMVDQSEPQTPAAAGLRRERAEFEKDRIGAPPAPEAPASEKSGALTLTTPALDALTAAETRQPPSDRAIESLGGRGLSTQGIAQKPADGLGAAQTHVAVLPNHGIGSGQEVYAGLSLEAPNVRLAEGNALVLEVSFADDGDVRAASERLTAWLAEMKISPGVFGRRADLAVGAAMPPPAGPKEVPGVRSEALGVEHDLLVHVPPDKLPRLLDTIAGTDSRARGVVLSAGPLQARGADRAKELLAFAGPDLMEGLRYGPFAPARDETEREEVDTFGVKDSRRPIFKPQHEKSSVPPDQAAGVSGASRAAPRAKAPTRESFDEHAIAPTSRPARSREPAPTPPSYRGAALSAGSRPPFVQDRPQTVAVLIHLVGPGDGPSSTAPASTTQP